MLRNKWRMKASTPKKVVKKAPIKTPIAGRKKVEFSIEAKAGSDVSVAGSFTGWRPRSLTAKGTGSIVKYGLVVFLPPGQYQYKFIINGEWITDPGCPATTINEFGTLNSLRHIV